MKQRNFRNESTEAQVATVLKMMEEKLTLFKDGVDVDALAKAEMTVEEEGATLAAIHKLGYKAEFRELAELLSARKEVEREEKVSHFMRIALRQQ